MTSDERNTLEAAALRRDLDAASWQRVATNARDVDMRQDCEATSEVALSDAAAIRAALAEVDALTQQVADLDARAIPKAWVESDHLIVSATFEDRAECVAVGRHIEGAWLAVTADAVSGGRTFPTLSAALSAAKEAP